MTSSNDTMVASSFRTYYGRLFSALLHQFGGINVSLIEDAIQNAFYRALKSWKPNKIPENQEAWLYIVAKNDLLNQLRKQSKPSLNFTELETYDHHEDANEDLRLKILLLLSRSPRLSAKSKVVFILKNIFGLHVKEISSATLIAEEAIYKIVKRAHKSIQEHHQDLDLDGAFEQVATEELTLVEEVIYAVFNIGFDSFNAKKSTAIDEELCIEALALTKLVWQRFGSITTQHLMALLCFHIARIPAKLESGKMVSFFNQDREKWNQDFMNLGFRYMVHPEELNKYYVESLIVSSHMTTAAMDDSHWTDIIRLYDILKSLVDSPIVSINKCYCLIKLGRLDEVKTIITELENELSNNHIYLSLVKAMAADKNESDAILSQVIGQLNQSIRRDFVVENLVRGRC